MSTIFDILFSSKRNIPEKLDLDSIEGVDLPLSLVFQSNNEYLDQRSSSHTFDPLNQKERINRGFTMRIKKGTKRLTLLKYLLSKFVYDHDGLHLDEYIVLHELYYDLSESRDPSFNQRYGRKLREISIFFQKLSEAKNFPLRWEKNQDSVETLASYFEDIVLSQNAYFGMKGNRNIRESFMLSFRDSVIPKKIPPKRFIGVGYKDKGSWRDPAFDGSPGWQSVASSYCNFERVLNEMFQVSEEEDAQTDDGRPPSLKE